MLTTSRLMASAQAQELALALISLSLQEERCPRSALLAARAALSRWTHCKNSGFKHQLLRRSLAARRVHRSQLLHDLVQISFTGRCLIICGMTHLMQTIGSLMPIAFPSQKNGRMILEGLSAGHYFCRVLAREGINQDTMDGIGPSSFLITRRYVYGFPKLRLRVSPPWLCGKLLRRRFNRS